MPPPENRQGCVTDDVLDRAAWASLAGPHRGLSVGTDRARRYRPELSPFAALHDVEDPRAWTDLAELHDDGEVALLTGPPGLDARQREGWTVVASVPGVQLVATSEVVAAPDPEAVVIGPARADAAAALVARTEPGPYRSRTWELGTYLGLEEGGRLVALAGERLHPPGWSEISAVCTAPEARGRGLATRLVRAVAAQAQSRGETTFLHVAATNVRAEELYLRLGFVRRRTVDFVAFRRVARS